jgi:MYXO-CTERM domain-containing protein
MRSLVICSSLGVIAITAQPAWGICRIISEVGSPPPAVQPAQSVLMVLRHQVQVGLTCMPNQTPPPPVMMGADLSVVAADDLGMPAEDLGPAVALDDGGLDEDGGGQSCVPRLGDTVTMVVQPQLAVVAGARFVMLMVTPAVPTVTLAPRSLFEHLADVTRTQVEVHDVEVEDPALGCKENDPYYSGSVGCGSDFGSNGGGSSSGSGGPGYSPPQPQPVSLDAGLPSAPLILGDYEVAVLAGADQSAVLEWLADHQYQYTSSDADALTPYTSLGWTVTAVRVHAAKASTQVAVDPLAFTWEGASLRLPIAISHQASSVPMPITVYVAAEGRYDFPGAAVTFAEHSNEIAGAGFLARNDLDLRFDLPAIKDPVAGRVSDDPEFHEVTVVQRIVKVPTTVCPGSNRDSGSKNGLFCGCRVGGAGAGAPPILLLLLSPLAALVSRRVRRRVQR